MTCANWMRKPLLLPQCCHADSQRRVQLWVSPRIIRMLDRERRDRDERVVVDGGEEGEEEGGWGGYVRDRGEEGGEG